MRHALPLAWLLSALTLVAVTPSLLQTAEAAGLAAYVA